MTTYNNRRNDPRYSWPAAPKPGPFYRKEKAMSFVVEVQESLNGAWVANGVRFATVEEAEFAKGSLAGRWFGPVGFRTAESDQPANYRWVVGESVRIEGTLQSDLALHRELKSNS